MCLENFDRNMVIYVPRDFEVLQSLKIIQYAVIDNWQLGLEDNRTKNY